MEWIKKHKKWISIIFIIMIVMFITATKLKAYSIAEVEFVEPYLEYDNLFIIILRNLGDWIYSMFSIFLNMAEQGFTELMKFDILQLEQIRKIIDNFQVIVYSLLFIMFVVVVLIRMFNFQNNLKTLYNVMMTFLVISIIGVSLSMLGNTKTVLVSEVDNIVKGDSHDTIAEKLYKDNTVDIVMSMKKGRVVYLSEIENLNLDYVSIDERIDKKMLNEYYTYDEDGVKTIEKLSNGLFGIGDERYLRYRTDYVAVNLTVIFATIIYGLGIFKLAYLVWNWLQLNIFSTLYLGVGFWEVSNIGRLFKQALQTIGGMVLLYFSMMLFTVFMSNIITTDLLSNYFVKAIVIFSAGMATVVGSGIVNEFLGIDDGSSFALKSIFVGSKLARMGKGMFNKGKDLLTSTFNTAQKGAELVDKGLEKGVNKTVSNVAQQMHNEFVRKEHQTAKNDAWAKSELEMEELQNRNTSGKPLSTDKQDAFKEQKKQEFIKTKQQENDEEWEKYRSGEINYMPMPEWYDYGAEFEEREREKEKKCEEEFERKNFDNEAFQEKMRKLREATGYKESEE